MPPPHSDESFTDAYRKCVARFASVAEPSSARYAFAPPGVGEKLARCLWFDRFLDADSLRTEDGRRLTVLSPGFWNEGAGPDFRNAELRFDRGEVLRGDVEVHLLATDYARHQHGGDPAYDSVILHVVFSNDLGSPFLETAGRPVPQLALDRHLTGDLAEVLEALDLAMPRETMRGSAGPCCGALKRRGLDKGWIDRFLDLAGDARVLAKAERFAASLAGSTPDQCLYEGLMDALGYKGNRRAFRQLAERASVAALRRHVPADGSLTERARAAEALLFGVAGLMPTEAEAAAWDDETRAYLDELRPLWQAATPEFGERLVARGAWRFAGTRPVNYPPRRIAAAAAYLSRHLPGGLFRGVVEALERGASVSSPARRSAAALRNVQALFLQDAQDGGGYWARRCHFGSKPLPRPMRLLGAERALAMIVNVIVPLVVAVARAEKNRPLERLLHGVYASLGRMAENSATRYMSARLFGDAAAARAVANSARRQQGLLQLYHDFCESRQTTCERCTLLALAAEEATPC